MPYGWTPAMETSDRAVFWTVLTVAIGIPQEPSIPTIPSSATNLKSFFIPAIDNDIDARLGERMGASPSKAST